MDYTIQKLAFLSGITVRTLHFYDEIGLLKPAYVGENGYRYYQEKQLLLLQQILFFREIGFELKEIKKILCKSDFDKQKTLHSHKKVLQKKVERLTQLMQTIDTTLNYLEGKNIMTEKQIFHGFDKEKQAKYEKQLVERFGTNVKEHIVHSNRNIKDWTVQDWNRASQEFAGICKDLTLLLEKKYEVGSEEVQAVINRHYEWIKQFWVPNKESYAGLALGYTEKEWKNTFDQYHGKLANYLSQAMQLFAQKL